MSGKFRSTGTAADKRRWQKSNIPKCHCARCVDKRQGFPRLGKIELREQLLEVPDNVRVFNDFRELPDDIFDSHGDFCPCRCECCTRTWNEEAVA